MHKCRLSLYTVLCVQWIIHLAIFAPVKVKHLQQLRIKRVKNIILEGSCNQFCNRKIQKMATFPSFTMRTTPKEGGGFKRWVFILEN